MQIYGWVGGGGGERTRPENPKDATQKRGIRIEELAERYFMKCRQIALAI